MVFATEHLNDARTVFARHGNAVVAALKEYRENVQLYDGRFAADYAAQQKIEAKTLAAGKVAQADREMHDRITEIVKEMRHNVGYVATNLPDEKVLTALDVYARNNIRMSETVIRAFAAKAAESHLAMCWLRSIAQKSGFNVNFPTIDDVENDIKRIEKAARVPSMCAVPEYAKEAAEVMGDIPWFRDDGSVYNRSGKPDALYFLNQSEARKRLENDMGSVMLDRWKGVQPVTIEPVAEDKHVSAEGNAATEGQATEDAAKQTTEERAAAEQAARKQYAEGLDVAKEDGNADAISAMNAESAAAAQSVRDRYFGKK